MPQLSGGSPVLVKLKLFDERHVLPENVNPALGPAPDPMVTLSVAAGHPAASVTDNVYAPAHKLLALEPEPPLGDHEYVKGVVPPLTEEEALPSQAPGQDSSTPVTVTVGGAETVMVMDAVAQHVGSEPSQIV